MALTKVIHSVVPLRSFQQVAQTVERYLSHVDTGSITITCNDSKVALTILQRPRRNSVHVFKYAYEWGEAAKEKEVAHAVGEVPRCSEGVPEVELRPGEASEGELGRDEVYDPTPEELAAEAQAQS